MSIPEVQAVELSVPPVDEVLDLHGDPARHDLALFMHGNQWMVMPALLREFQAAYPSAWNIYYETLPPGTLEQQMRLGVLRLGDLTVRVAPDVLTGGVDTLSRLGREGWLGECYEYATSTLALLVQGGNPQAVGGWSDLLLPSVRVALPDPQTEGIARLVRDAVVETLGPDAWTELAVRKVRRGQARFTRIHHRETPLLLLAGEVDAGPVWVTEGLYQERLGQPLETVSLPRAQNRRGHYAVAVAERTSNHPDAAWAFVEFMRSPVARAVYASYGFGRPRPHERGHAA